MAARNFDIATGAEDWAAPGREVECPVTEPGEAEFIEKYGSLTRRQQMYIRVNGWTFSAVWGSGTYCTGARAAGLMSEPPPCSPDAEIAVWRGDGGMIDLHGDSVEGWVLPASLEAAIAAAEQDDEDGIRAALVAREDD
jgi:hypothetical protein